MVLTVCTPIGIARQLDTNLTKCVLYLRIPDISLAVRSPTGDTYSKFLSTSTLTSNPLRSSSISNTIAKSGVSHPNIYVVEPSSVSEDDIAGDDVAGDDIAEDDVSGDDVSGDDVSGDDVSEDDIAGDDVSEDDLTYI